jgi:hypothetical protein
VDSKITVNLFKKSNLNYVAQKDLDRQLDDYNKKGSEE